MKSLALIAVVACGLALVASLARSALADRPATAAAIRCATPAKWRGSGVHAGNWRIGCQVCSSFSLRNLARQLHTARNAVAVATKYAKGYRLAYRQAPFEGCLYGILHRR
jgi:hypothetical protein